MMWAPMALLTSGRFPDSMNQPTAISTTSCIYYKNGYFFFFLSYFPVFIIVNPFPIPFLCPFIRPFVFLANNLPLLNPKCYFFTGQYFLVVIDYREDVAELVCMFVGDGVEHVEQGHHHHLALRVLDQTLHQT